MSRYDLTDFEWRLIEPLLPNKPRGIPRVDDRRVLNGIFWVLRSGAPWRDLPERYGPRTTCYNRFVRWRKADVWDRLMDAITAANTCDHARPRKNITHRWHRERASGAAVPSREDGFGPKGLNCVHFQLRLLSQPAFQL